MNKVFLFIGVSFLVCSAQAQDIFKKHGFDKETLTLSKGRYEEVFTNKEIVQIGSVLLNTKTNKVVKFLDEETEDVSFKAEYSSRWLSPDPLAEKYPQLSPYVFCANNPVNNVDKNGKDWYRHDESGAVIWQEGNATSVTVQDQTYNNIGETYSETFGNETYNYTQNNLGSITYTGITDNDWVSQITTKTNCYQASSQMLSNVGVTTAGRGSEVIVVNLGDNGRAGTGNDNLNTGISVVNSALENGNPIMVGVDYKNGSPNADGMTDHFIVVSSMTQTVSNGNVTGTTYNFFDPGTSNSTWGTSPNNTLSVSNNQITGTYVNKPTQPYTVVTVRRNR